MPDALTLPVMSRDDSRPVAVLGATGYIGARLVPRLLAAGWLVRAIGRNPAKLAGRPWAADPRVEIVPGDVLDRFVCCRGSVLLHRIRTGVVSGQSKFDVTVEVVEGQRVRTREEPAP